MGMGMVRESSLSVAPGGLINRWRVYSSSV